MKKFFGKLKNKANSLVISAKTTLDNARAEGYNSSVTAPTAKSGSATWNMWVYENGGFVLKQYGVSVTSTDPDLLPSSACLTAEKVGRVNE